MKRMTRGEAIDIFKCLAYHDLRPTEKELSEAIEALEEQKGGEWVWDGVDAYLCSECASGYKEQPTLMGKPMFKYCPICGARMRGGE